LAPSAKPLGRARNLFLNWAVQKIAFGGEHRYLNERRRSLSLPPLDAFFLNEVLQCFTVYLQATVPMFEYPRSDLPDHVRFIGPLLPEGGADFEPPEWWHELRDARKVVLVTQGTVATDTTQLIEPTLRALADREDLFVLATAPGWRGDSAMIPSNAHVERFVPYAHLFPHVDLLITNGGYGGVQFALSHGVPVVVVGASEEKLEIAARVDWSGVGISVRSLRGTPTQIREAVARVLGDPNYRARAQVFAAEARDYDAVATAAEELETAAARG
jgi:MGT family glycosyltransferase